MRVAIVGAGIAGLTAAIALAARGFSVDVFERAAQLDEIGAGIQLSPNAMAVLERLGVVPLLGRLLEPVAIEIGNGVSGRRLTRIPLGPVARRRYGAPYCVLSRADLQKGLAEALGRSGRAKLHLGAGIGIPAMRSDGVRLDAGDGAVEAEILVAADGVGSRLRSAHFGLSGARPTGSTAWRATLAASEARDVVPLDAVGLWLMPGAHLVHYPIDGGDRLNLVLIAEGPSRGGHDASGVPRLLIDRVAEWTAWPLAVADERAPWVKGRAVLIGDAAHAMPPTLAQGGAMAIEDSFVLAQSLAACGDANAGLFAYETLRRTRVERVAREARRNRRLYEARGPLRVARDLALAALPAKFQLARLDWLFAWTPEAKFPLPGERPSP